ncbi:MAG: D-sedoheptulose 7-phosphate isomerase [Desulfarculaceae bacterium]|nr:D-sedoheptulose 7-phosphate isomerase [Desulfarculaceae bacterium]MCF8070975.1 D-sedoheptulose 7-phosphate isomerase [Desulfarculaceae bacterium]MCF8100563.1 D-sedoheptulose 7-phosphate isomerase [Desulfarculaceae bacterium]MCF8116589.1 D-sedoheptulose 7-phosphate isomerase [Desulfarculaceae bacterium]
MQEIAEAALKRAIEVHHEFQRSGLEQVVAAAQLISRGLAAGGKLMAMGNGGSAADAQHLSAELVNRFLMERPGLPGIALTTDTSILTAVANDYDYNQVFSKQIKALAVDGDMVLGLSTSGRSPNVIAGLAAARQRGLATIGLTGRNSEAMGPLCDILIQVPSDETPRIQEMHAFSIHMICELVDLTLFGRSQ